MLEEERLDSDFTWGVLSERIEIPGSVDSTASLCTPTKTIGAKCPKPSRPPEKPDSGSSRYHMMSCRSWTVASMEGGGDLGDPQPGSRPADFSTSATSAVEDTCWSPRYDMMRRNIKSYHIVCHDHI